jgi:hypothetical protein
MDEQQLKDFIDELKKILNNRTAIKNKADQFVANKRYIDVINKSTKDLKKAAGADKEARAAVEAFTEEVEKSKKEHRAFIQETKKLSTAFKGLGAAAFAGEGSISAFTDNFRNVGVIGDSLGFLGNRLDVNIETFRQLSQVGASFGQSIVDLRQTAATAALPLDDFAKLVGTNSEALAALFGSTTQGAKQISLLAESVRTQGIPSLAPLGFTVDELNETLLLNLDRQRRTNIFDRLTSQQRIDSAIRFAEELDRLARLTGAQRDELRAQIEQQQSNTKFQAFLQNATDGARTRLEGFAASIGTIAPGLTEGFQDLIANAGVPVTESALALVQNIPQARDVVNDLISGTINSEMALSRLRDAAGSSIQRFQKATVTGQVEFLNLQGDVINLARRINDVDSIFAEQGETADRLTQGLTTFEDASKRIAGQFQQIETGLLGAFGPALGGLSQATQFLMKGVGGLVAGIAQVPALTGTAIAGVLAGKFLFSRADQIGIVATGTAIGTGGGFTKLAQGLGLKGMSLGKLGKFGAGRILPGVGAAIGVGSSAGMLMNKDKSDDAAGIGGLGGAALGAAIGTMIAPGIGTLIGAGLGSIVGQGAGSLIGNKNKRALGTSGATGQLFEPATSILQVEKGERVLNQAETQAVNNFSTVELENKMNTMVTELNNANKTLTNMVNGVNTLVAVDSRTMKAVERTARKDVNQIGLV